MARSIQRMAADRLSMLAATIAMIVVLLAWSAVSQDNGWLALDVEVVTKADAEKIGWKTPRGVRVKAVAPGSTAEEAGLKVGDIILSVDGVDILSIDGADIDQPTAFHRAVEAKAPGMRVNLTVYSNSRERQVVAYLEFPAPIVRGDATSIGVFPYIGSLRYYDQGTGGYVCGGSMIAPSWFLTAAHCVAVLADEGTLVGHYPDDKGEMRQGVLEVVLGLDDLSSASPSAAYAVNKVVVHEQFMRTYRQIRAKGYAPWRAVDLAAMSGGHDIALINLKRPWEGRLARISTSAKTDPQTPGSTLHVAGFGFSDPNPTKRVMRQFRRGEHEVYFAGS